ncbi:MAG: Holliday junction branch migration DNA helicase RuvB [Candidatus Gracilibacteria bacterium]|nr:Holliday junction branch migration DNA helicase RuvB [Candidatus Gracilibacteria bacterium]
MAIKSSKTNNRQEKNQAQEDRIISSQEKVTDKTIDNSLRPKFLDDYVGQSSIKKHLDVSIKSAQIRAQCLGHILFYGPPGLGKTTLSQIISNEMGSNIKITSGPAVEKQADLVSLLTNLEQGDVLFIDEIHRLRPQIEEILYTAMEDFNIDIMVGKGTGATSVRMDLPEFTLIGATTRLSSLSAPLRDRFGNVLKLDFYNSSELSEIILKNAKKLEVPLTDKTAENIAKRSRGTPRIANRLLKIIRDYFTIGKDISNEEILNNIFCDLNIDDLGLDSLDKQYLENIYYKFAGGPVGLNTLASAIGEEEDTIEDVVEPYLLQIGFLERTPRGRKITESGIAQIINNNK